MEIVASRAMHVYIADVVAHAHEGLLGKDAVKASQDSLTCKSVFESRY